MSSYYKEGGSVEDSNREMLMNQAIEFKHHAEELMKAIKDNTEVDAWVIAKAERATTDLSDITHYLEGEYKKFKMGGMMEDGGMMEEGVDLFEDSENIPQAVQEVLDYHSEAFEFGDYRKLEDALVDLENIGYTFEFDLNGMPYDLREIGQVGKSEVDEEEYANGGMMNDYKNNLSQVTVKFKNPTYNYTTNVSGSVNESDARAYFVGNYFNVAKYPRENMQKVIDIDFQAKGTYAKGGRMKMDMKSSFEDRVDSISKRLKGKKVPKNLKSDYGRTYSDLESQLAAMRIAGSMRKKGY